MNVNDLQQGNLATKLDEELLEEIGRDVVNNYEVDKKSRKKWEETNKEAIELALQVVKEKTFPWENAANIKFPLLTIAALQFASRVYPSLIKAPDLVKMRVQGQDPGGDKAARAQRISAHMSYQMLEEDEAWEEQTDKAYFALPILGSVFKKSYHDITKGHNCSEMVLPMDLVVHYYAKDLETAERKTHCFELSERRIKERVLRKVYRQCELTPVPVEGPSDADKRQGMEPPIQDTERPRMVLEQHCYLDLDKDGYKEPYIVTVDKTTQKVFRIVHRFKKVITEQSLEIDELTNRMRDLALSLPPPGSGQEDPQLMAAAEQTVMAIQQKIEKLNSEKPKVLRIEPIEYFTKIPFIPSPDGGFYDIGFGLLLGPLNNSVSTLINQLIDAGTLQNGSSGFIGRGARIKGGKLRFSPNEWKRVDVAGSTLRDSLVPLPVNPPSSVLFQLLGLLINYTERVSSVTDLMAGENPGQNTPAYNMSAMLEQGMQVFNGIFKRVYRAFRSEIRKLYDLNALYLDEFAYLDYHDNPISREDYKGDPKDLIPAADPNAFAQKEKQQKAQMVAERSMMVPGYDSIKVEQNLLESMDIPNAKEIYPVVQGEDGSLQLAFPPQPDPEVELKKAEEQRRTKEAEDRAEVNYMLADAKLAESEANVILKLAQAEKEADAPELERLKLIAQELGDQRKLLLEKAKLEEGRDKGLGGESGN